MTLGGFENTEERIPRKIKTTLMLEDKNECDDWVSQTTQDKLGCDCHNSIFIWWDLKTDYTAANKCFPLEVTPYILHDEILLLMGVVLQRGQKYFIKWILCMG